MYMLQLLLLEGVVVQKQKLHTGGELKGKKVRFTHNRNMAGHMAGSVTRYEKQRANWMDKNGEAEL